MLVRLEDVEDGMACPFHVNGQQGGNCIAAECMAWRWYDVGTYDDETMTWRFPKLNHPEMGRPGRERIEHELLSRRGYCGQIGKPEIL